MKAIEKLKENLLSNEKIITEDFEFGYSYKYKDYISNDCYKKLIEEMEKNYNIHYNQIKSGSGNELNEDNGPPKFASIRSSSRFCFNVFKEYLIDDSTKQQKKLVFNFTGVDEVYNDLYFELKLNILNPTAHPNMDVVLTSEDSIVFVESKLLEPLTKTKIKFAKSYKYKLENTFKDNNVTIKGDDAIVDFNNSGESYFDLPQAIKHMFGIKQFIIDSINNENHKLNYKKNSEIDLGEVRLENRKNICLCFLTYKPTIDDKDINEIYDNIKPNKSGVIPIDNINFEKIFNEVFADIRYLCDENCIKINYKFISQYDFKNIEV